jgi:hypothetical protein
MADFFMPARPFLSSMNLSGWRSDGSDLRSAGRLGYPYQPVRDNADMKMKGFKMPT